MVFRITINIPQTTTFQEAWRREIQGNANSTPSSSTILTPSTSTTAINPPNTTTNPVQTRYPLRQRRPTTTAKVLKRQQKLILHPPKAPSPSKFRLNPPKLPAWDWLHEGQRAVKRREVEKWLMNTEETGDKTMNDDGSSEEEPLKDVMARIRRGSKKSSPPRRKTTYTTTTYRPGRVPAPLWRGQQVKIKQEEEEEEEEGGRRGGEKGKWAGEPVLRLRGGRKW